MTVSNTLVPDHAFGEPWTIDDLKKLPHDEANRYELYNGSLFVTPQAGVFHGGTANSLDHILTLQVPEDLIVGQGMGVSRKVTSYFIPDIFVGRRAAFRSGGDALDPADVLLVVEVLSPSNRRNDLVLKRDGYAVAGVPLYWIVDPEEQTIMVLELGAGGLYEDVVTVRPGQVWRTDRPFPLAFDPAEIF
jgi:Uma2 family endonuclease